MWLIVFFFLLHNITCDRIKNASQDTAIGNSSARRSFFRPYLSGLMIAVSPANMVFWLGIFAAALAASLQQEMDGPNTH